MIGSTVSHYKILSKLGEGGMGVVYKARDTRLDRIVALKFLHSDQIQSDEDFERFRREAKAVSAMNHPNITTVHEFDEADGTWFIVFEYLSSGNLRDRLEEMRSAGKTYSEAQVIDWGRQIARGLVHAHKAGVVHRDLKPANILIDDQRNLRITDFGLAKRDEDTKLTKTGTTVGTLAYMSPEQVRAEETDERSDLFSLGVILFELATGELPFRGDHNAAITYSIVNEKPRKPRSIRPDLSPSLEAVILKCLEKEVGDRFKSAGELLTALEGPSQTDFSRNSARPSGRRGLLGAVIVVVILALIVAGYWVTRVHWARTEAMERAQRMIDEVEGMAMWGAYEQAFELAQKSRKYIGNDPELDLLLSSCSNSVAPISFFSDPPGARVLFRNYAFPERAWKPLGETPVIDQVLPMGYYVVRFEKEGLVPVETVILSWNESRLSEVRKSLEPIESAPSGMVRVSGADWHDLGHLPDFYMDKTEVTNAEFKKFVVGGGYRERAYWRPPFIENGKEVAWEKAMKRFVDSTGRPGPAIWRAGDFPAGREADPVSGISWYEAAAFCEFAGKDLPTSHHWERASMPSPIYRFGFLPLLYAQSNIHGEGPLAAGEKRAITAFGALDMAGNVREWCWNESPRGRMISGGAWDDIEYMFTKRTQLSPWDRSSRNGVRCMQCPAPDEIPPAFFDPVDLTRSYDYRDAERIGDEVFEAYRARYDYDPADLDARIEEREEGRGEWVREKVTMNAAYGNARIIAYIYLPRAVEPPFQTVVYFPHDGVWHSPPLPESHHRGNLDFFVKSGRAAVFPIYIGSHERSNEIFEKDWESANFPDLVVRWVKDFRRVLDYLEARDDVDMEKLAFYGVSRGGEMGGIIPAVEPRVKLVMLNVGGFGGEPRPEVNPVSYVSRITVPTLMLNGRFDPTFPIETDVEPFFELLGALPEQKRLMIYETDHNIPHGEVIRECLAWMDTYFGPVR